MKYTRSTVESIARFTRIVEIPVYPCAVSTVPSMWLRPATRSLPGQKQTNSRIEFIGILDALMEADEKYLSPTGRAVITEDDIAEVSDW